MVTILGITWGRSVLVSFDPSTGNITRKHAWLNPKENFVGLAYDCNRNRLYALSQVTCNLYCIDPLTRDVSLIGKLNVPAGADTSSLAYNPLDDILYTVVLSGGIGGPFRSDLGKVDVHTANVAMVGKIGDGICNSLCWRESDGQLNGYIVYGNAASDTASVLRIDPQTAAMTALFQTTYHTILGLARRPGRNAYVSYLNGAAGGLYGEVNLDTQTITALGNNANAGIESPAMVYKNFYVASAPNLPPCSFQDDDCLGPAT